MQRVSQVLLVVTLGLLALQAEVSAESIIKDVLSPLGDGVNEIEWVGNGGKVATRTNILLTTHDGSLFRSGDNGDTWMAQDKKRLGYNPASASDSGRTLLSTPKATWSDSTTRRLLTQQSYEASDDETYAAAKTAVAAASDDESMAVSDEEPATDADADDEFDTQYYSDDENEKYVSSTDDVEISDMEISDEELDDIDDICPSTKNIGSLDCSEGNIECEDLYSYCPNVAQGCLDMQCGASVSNSLSPVEEDKVLKLDPHPSDTLAGLVFITGMKKNNWVTTDGGAAYTNVQTNFILRGLKWHPYRKWALAYESNIECLYERTHRCFGNLMLSIDGGLTWKRIAWNIKYPNYAWLQLVLAKPGRTGRTSWLCSTRRIAAPSSLGILSWISFTPTTSLRIHNRCSLVATTSPSSTSTSSLLWPIPKQMFLFGSARTTVKHSVWSRCLQTWLKGRMEFCTQQSSRASLSCVLVKSKPSMELSTSRMSRALQWPSHSTMHITSAAGMPTLSKYRESRVSTSSILWPQTLMVQTSMMSWRMASNTLNKNQSPPSSPPKFHSTREASGAT